MHIKCTREWRIRVSTLPRHLSIPSRRSHSLPTTSSRHPRRGRKLCRWRRKALINTTVSDRYADPRHCKMAAISPSHSSGRQPSPAFSSSLFPLSLLSPSPVVHWTPEGVSVSHSLPALPRHPYFAPPQLALLIFTPRPRRRRRRHRHTKSSGWKYALSRPVQLV